MNNILLFLLLMFPFTVTQGQQTSSYILLDAKTGKPVPYASIKLLGKAGGGYSNEAGVFEVEATKSDSISITSIGYESIRLILPEASGTISLQPLYKELETVTIEANASGKTLLLGIKKRKADMHWGPSGFTEEFAQKIVFPVNHERYLIKKIFLPIRFFTPLIPTVLHIYSVDLATGIPDKELLSSQHLVTRKNIYGNEAIFDISAENLVLTEKAVFVGLEWLGRKRGLEKGRPSGNHISITYDIPEQLTYSRTMSHSDYRWSPRHLNKNIINTMFTVEVQVLK